MTERDVVFQNRPADLSISVQQQVISNIRICGSAASIEAITEADLRAVVDAGANTGLGSVRYAVRIEVPAYDDGVGLLRRRGPVHLWDLRTGRTSVGQKRRWNAPAGQRKTAAGRSVSRSIAVPAADTANARLTCICAENSCPFRWIFIRKVHPLFRKMLDVTLKMRETPEMGRKPLRSHWICGSIYRYSCVTITEED